MSTCWASRVISKSGTTTGSSRSLRPSRSPTTTPGRCRSSASDVLDAGHVPVLVDEVRALLQPERGGTFVDCTVGLGGHARMLLESGATRLIGIDRDTSALAIARETLAPFADRVTLVHADYREMPRVLDAEQAGDVAGVLADLGVASMQLDEAGRGFSFRRDEPLDMRMDRTAGETAADAMAAADEQTLAD